MRVPLLLAVLFALVTGSYASAQKQDPKALEVLDHARLLTLAAAKGLPAYRLEASIETFDDKGVSNGTGTVVQTALPDGHRRQVVTLHGKTLDSIWFNGVQRVADPGYEETIAVRSLLNALTDIVPSAEELKQRTVQAHSESSGLKMDCAVITGQPHDPRDIHPVDRKYTFCMDASNGMVRMAAVQNSVLVLNQFRKLGSAYIPGDLQMAQDGVRVASLKITRFVTDSSMSAADFLATVSDGKVIPTRIVVDTNTVIDKAQPTYPPASAWSGQKGTVTLKVIIGTDGVVKEVTAVSSPSALLTDSAIAAVRKWRYEPYLVDREPIEVEATVKVNYSSGR